MRSLKYLLRRSITNESVRYVYHWLFSRAQHLVQRSRSHLPFTKSKSLFNQFRSLISQYHRHVPVEYLCGSAAFCNRLFIVNRHVLIPRRDSESLIDHVQQLYGQTAQRHSVLEIGTGSGCLSITLACLYPHWQIDACDISSAALRIARQNASLHRCQHIRFHRGDLFDEHFLQTKSFDLIISNPPYISSNELSSCDRGIFHEPSIALFVDPPLKFYSTIIQRAKHHWLRPDGYLIFECSPFNVDPIRNLFIAEDQFFDQIDVRFDTNATARVISARKKRLLADV